MSDFWEETYRRGEQLNEWPASSVVSVVNNLFNSKANSLRALEMGSGAGNNLRFLAQKFDQVVGLESSSTAVQVSNDRYQALENVEVIHGSFVQAPPLELRDSFDFVLDRAAICHVKSSEIMSSLRFAFQVLKPGGIFYSEGFFDEAESPPGKKIRISDHGDFSDLSGENFSEHLRRSGFLELRCEEDIRRLVGPYSYTLHKTRYTWAQKPHFSRTN